MLDCPSCQTPNAVGHQFCSGCGKPLPLVCRSCAFANSPGAKFCGGCGVPLAAADGRAEPHAPTSGDRRQVTILFADLCEFTRLSSERDAEEVHQLLGRFFEV